MSKQGNKSSWDDLAKMLETEGLAGVHDERQPEQSTNLPSEEAPPLAPEEPRSLPSDTPEASQPDPPPTPQCERPAVSHSVRPRSSDWGLLASELGLSLPATAASRKTEQPDRKPAIASGDTSKAEARPPESHAASPSTPPPQDRPVETRTELQVVPTEPSVKPIVVADPVEDSSAKEESTTVRRRRRRGGRRRGTGGEQSRPSGDAPAETPEVISLPDASVQRKGQRDDEAGGETVERPARKRRRRRGSRGTNREDISSTAEESTLEIGAESAKPRRRRRSSQNAPRPESETPVRSLSATESDADIEDAPREQAAEQPSESPEKPAAKRPSHKNIPTWQETVGVMIDSNLASRTSGGGRSQRGGSRGRGRGRKR